MSDQKDEMYTLAAKRWQELGLSWDALADDRDRLRDELAAVRGELERMQAEREPVDNGDGTETALRPVTYRKEWSGRVVACRKPRLDEAYADCFCNECVAEFGDKFDDDDVVLILSPPEPASPEPEPVDNGDGTETKLLPVTYPKGVDVVEVRSRRTGDVYVDYDGEILDCQDDYVASPGEVWLITRQLPKPPEPAKPEPVTWEAPFISGEWTATPVGWSDGTGVQYAWDATGTLIQGMGRPPQLGRYLFKDGVGTLIEASK
jgi:hypothetical protein